MEQKTDQGKKTSFSSLSDIFIRFQSISSSDKMFFAQHIGVMIKAGVSLSKSLKTLAMQTNNRRFASILLDISQNVEKGDSLGKSLQKYEDVFGQLFVNMVKSGEVSGKLEEVFGQLFIQLKKSHELVAKIRNALIYPIVVIIAMLGIGVAMIIFVIPKLTVVFKEFNTELPYATRLLILVSDALSKHGIISVLIIIILIFSGIKLLRTKLGRKISGKIILRVPIFSTIIKKINLARFARTMSSLIRTDIPIIDSFKTVAGVMGNSSYKEGLLGISEDIKKGVTIKESMAKYPNIFPPIVLQMISIGEETGSLDEILNEIANFYEEEVSDIMSTLPSIIEPLLMLVLGGAVAFMAVAIIMPMYSLTQQI